MEVVIAINCTAFADVKKRILQAREFLPNGGWLQMDVSDGKFDPSRNWNRPERLREWLDETGLQGLKIEAHLMVVDPLPQAMRWLEAGADRVVVHVEAVEEKYIPFLKGLGKGKVGVALVPGTSVRKAQRFIREFPLVQLLAVPPGSSGQRFDRHTVKKIADVRKLAPKAKIEIDGGMNGETARAIRAAGADIVVSGSYVLKADDPKAAYRELRRL